MRSRPSAERMPTRSSSGSAKDPSSRPMRLVPNVLMDAPMSLRRPPVTPRLKNVSRGSVIASQTSENQFEPSSRVLTHDDQIHCSALESVELPKWRKDRVLLIGDAAHASSPMMGQGGCMAVEDAAVLAELLETSTSIDAALDAFSPRRRPRVDWIQAQSDKLARDALAPAAARDPVIKERGAQAFRDRFAPLLPAP